MESDDLVAQHIIASPTHSTKEQAFHLAANKKSLGLSCALINKPHNVIGEHYACIYMGLNS